MSDGFAFLVLLISLAAIGFSIYFFPKILQYVRKATDIYKMMLRRQYAMIDLCVDVLDNKKTFSAVQANFPEEEYLGDATYRPRYEHDENNDVYKDSNEVPTHSTYCPRCKKNGVYKDVTSDLYYANCRRIVTPR